MCTVMKLQCTSFKLASRVASEGELTSAKNVPAFVGCSPLLSLKRDVYAAPPEISRGPFAKLFEASLVLLDRKLPTRGAKQDLVSFRDPGS